MKAYIKRLFDEHKFARRFSFFWAIAIVSVLVAFIWFKPAAINNGYIVSALGLITAIVTVPIAWYFKTRDK